MRIAHLFATLIAVLAAVVLPCCAQDYNSSYISRHSPRSLHSHNIIFDVDEGDSLRGPGTWSKKWQDVVRKESINESVIIDCCPSIPEMVEPRGGKNTQDMYVELFSDGNIKQRFFEVSCRPDVENKPCRFLDRKLFNQSRCVQKFSYTYALVRDHGDAGGGNGERRHFSSLPGGGWAMDYIKIRSGCACEIRPQPQQQQQRRHRHPQGRRVPPGERKRSHGRKKERHHHHAQQQLP